MKGLQKQFRMVFLVVPGCLGKITRFLIQIQPTEKSIPSFEKEK